MMEWLNEPPAWRTEGDTITVSAAPRTDFWRITHDGNVRDNGHFYHQSVGGDFVAEVRVAGRYSGLYDQAGLMVRLDEATWLKCGVELVDGAQQASVVVTRDWSDWSLVPIPNPEAVWLRVSRRGPTLEVHYSLDGTAYTLIRQTYLADVPSLKVGLMVAAPGSRGFEATFSGFRVQRA